MGAAAKQPDWSTGVNRQPDRVREVFSALENAYPDARLILDFSTPFQLLCATILAAQSTDIRVNQVTPLLFDRFPSPGELSRAEFDEVASIVHSTGFFRQKTKRLIEVSSQLVERFDGEVPRTLEELNSLPGVGKKTAIIVINHAFGVPAGVAVDTHVKRIAQRLDWAHERDPDKIEVQLHEIIPKKYWIRAQDFLAFHGRAHCKARKPLCAGCPIHRFCYCSDKSEAGR